MLIKYRVRASDCSISGGVAVGTNEDVRLHGETDKAANADRSDDGRQMNVDEDGEIHCPAVERVAPEAFSLWSR